MQSDLVDAIRARIASPLSGSFAVAFVVTNWKALYTLARGSEQTSADTISKAATLLETGLGAWFEGRGWYLVPLLVATGYVAVYPMLQIPFDLWRKQVEVWNENWQRGIVDRGFRLANHQLIEHPKYKEAMQTADRMTALLKVVWRPGNAPNGGKIGVDFINTINSVGERTPVLLISAPNGFKSIHPHGNYNLEKCLCAFETVADRRFLAVPNGGMVPWTWDLSYKYIGFASGKAAPLVDGLEPSGPFIERLDETWGVFRARDFPHETSPEAGTKNAVLA